jgi:hypothetical protein
MFIALCLRYAVLQIVAATFGSRGRRLAPLGALVVVDVVQHGQQQRQRSDFRASTARVELHRRRRAASSCISSQVNAPPALSQLFETLQHSHTLTHNVNTSASIPHAEGSMRAALVSTSTSGASTSSVRVRAASRSPSPARKPTSPSGFTEMRSLSAGQVARRRSRSRRDIHSDAPSPPPPSNAPVFSAHGLRAGSLNSPQPVQRFRAVGAPTSGYTPRVRFLMTIVTAVVTLLTRFTFTLSRRRSLSSDSPTNHCTCQYARRARRQRSAAAVRRCRFACARRHISRRCRRAPRRRRRPAAAAACRSRCRASSATRRPTRSAIDVDVARQRAPPPCRRRAAAARIRASRSIGSRCRAARRAAATRSRRVARRTSACC